MTEVEEATGATIRFEVKYNLPSVDNDPVVFNSWWELAGALFGEEKATLLDRPSMGGEDFACYLQHAPGCMLRLGVGSPGKPAHMLHSPHFDINENVLVLGPQLLAAYTLNSATTEPS